MRLLAATIIATLALSCAAYGSGASEDDSFSCPGIEAVSIDAKFLNVDVRGHDESGASVSAEARGCKVLHQVEGARLRVWVEKSWPLGRLPGGTLFVQCPRGADLKIETVSGSLSVESMESESCSLRTFSGQIRVRASRGALTASSVSGRVLLVGDTGRIVARTVSGAIQGRGLVVESSAFSTISGDVDIGLDTPLDTLRFDLRSISGRIVVGNIRVERGLRMGTAGAPLVRGHSVSGALVFR